MVPSETDVTTIAQSVLQSVLAQSSSQCLEPADLDGDESVHGRIQIQGSWDGVVDVRASGGFCELAACKIFRTNPTAVTRSDKEDSITEIANMVGGAIKGLVTAPSRLSLPTIVSQQEAGTTAPIDTVSVTLCFGHHAIAIDVHEFSTAPA